MAFKHIKTIAVVLTTITASVIATPFFQNKGTKDCSSAAIPRPDGCINIVDPLHGWDWFNHEHDGTVTQVDNVHFEGDESLRMFQTYDKDYHERYHSEAIKTNAYTIGDTGFYGFAFRLSSDWDTTPGQMYNVAQFIADFTKDSHNTCKEGWLPSMMMWVAGNQLRTRRKGNSMCGPWTQKYDYEEYTVGTVIPGKWHRVVIQGSWKSDESGYYKVWFDGVKQVEALGKITTYKDEGKAHHFQFSVGLYANSWHDQEKLVGQGTRQLWIDEVGIGSEFKDADPNQW
ncbi:MAG: hypothetical protein Q9160_006147 [Pyrenula sp. 1 TL-2023]